MKKWIKICLAVFCAILGIIFIGGAFDGDGFTGSIASMGIVFLIIAALLIRSVITGEKLLKLEADKYYALMKTKADNYYSEKVKSADDYSEKKRAEANSEADRYYNNAVDAAMADSPIDLYILQSIKSQLAKQETDENIVEGEELTEEESTTHWQEIYHGETIVFSRSENEIKIRYQHHTIVCMLNDADEIMSYEYI